MTKPIAGPFSEREIDIAEWAFQRAMETVAIVERDLQIPAAQQYHDVFHTGDDVRARLRRSLEARVSQARGQRPMDA